MRRFGGLAFSLACGCLGIGALSGEAQAQQTRWVDASNCPGPGSGTEADPYCKIQDAICNLKDIGGGTVYVGPGNYNEAVRMFPGIDLISTDGPLVTTIDPTNPVVQPCITSSCTVGTTASCSGVYFGSGANGRIEGFRITNGRGINQTCAGGCNVMIGGGITVFNGSPTITRNEIVNNTVLRASNQTKSYYGGGIYVQGDDRNMVARPVITNNLIEGNIADPPAGKNNDPSRGIGGGIYAGFYSAPIVRGNRVRSNRAGNPNTADQQGGGGGIAFYSGIDVNPAVVDGNSVENNIASDYGGGVVLGEFLEGGQTVVSPSRGTVENNVVFGNDAFDGAGLQTNTTHVVVRNNTIVDNFASSGTTIPARGGGIQVYPPARAEAIVTLVNNLVAFNTADDSTEAEPGEGGGLYVTSGVDPIVRHDDLFGNLPGNVGGAKTDGDYIGTNGNVSVDPLFVDRPLRNYRLGATSPVLEAGDPMQTPGTDFDGTPRPQDADFDGTAVVDLGAFELPTDFDGDGTPDWQDPDDDEDGTLDAQDCAPFRRSVSRAPEPVGLSLRIRKEAAGAVLRWNRSLEGHTYNVYRGTIQEPWTYDETCFDDESPDGSAVDPNVPDPGQGFYYLVAARNSCGDSTFADGRSPASACAPANRDSDGDLLVDPGDNCPLVGNPLQGDADGDFVGDACDLCPSTYDPEQQDADGDLRADACDNCPAVANADQLDTDSDGVGDLCDNCASVGNPAQLDTDLDGLGDLCDPDDDNDSVADELDNCPLTPNAAQSDLDFDGLGDPCDPDDDNDSVADGLDNCPIDPNGGQEDGDLDAIGDACDNCPFVSNANQADADLDTVGDLCDNCLATANADQADADLDNVGDLCDACPNDAANDADTDGICADSDNCPTVANADQLDFDLDGLGDLCDPDDDNDGVDDATDCAPRNGSVSDPPDEVANLVLSGAGMTTLSWTGQGGGSVYDVVGGAVSTLRSEAGVGSASCLENDVAAETWIDGRTDPPQNDGYYYLLRAENVCGKGSYGRSSQGGERVPGAGCP